MRLRRVFAAAVLALMIAFLTLKGVVFAHHSRAHYGTEESTTKGVVLEYKWRNPPCLRRLGSERSKRENHAVGRRNGFLNLDDR